MISFGADPFFLRAPDIASAVLTLLLLISAWRRFHVSCLRLIVVSKVECGTTAWDVKLRQCRITCWKKVAEVHRSAVFLHGKHLFAGLQRLVLHVLRVLGPVRSPETSRAKRTLGQCVDQCSHSYLARIFFLYFDFWG